MEKIRDISKENYYQIVGEITNNNRLTVMNPNFYDIPKWLQELKDGYYIWNSQPFFKYNGSYYYPSNYENHSLKTVRKKVC